MVQSNKSPSGSSIVRLKDEISTETPEVSLTGITLEKLGGLFPVSDPVVKVYVLLVQLLSSVALTNQV